jgi:hypothetical protein
MMEALKLDGRLMCSSVRSAAVSAPGWLRFPEMRPIGVRADGDRILHTVCCRRTMSLGLHIAVHARNKSLLRHTAGLSLGKRDKRNATVASMMMLS